MLGLRRVLPQAMEVVLPQSLADPREHIHDVVVVMDVVSDRNEDESSILTDELIPCILAPTLFECDAPSLHESVFNA